MHDCVHDFSSNLHVISAFFNDVLLKGINSKILSDLLIKLQHDRYVLLEIIIRCNVFIFY